MTQTHSPTPYQPRPSIVSPSRALGWLDTLLTAGLIVNALALPWLIYASATSGNIKTSIFGSDNRVLGWLGILVILGTLEWIIWLLWRVVRNTRLGQVFSAQNVTHFRILGWLFFAWAASQHWLPNVWRLFTGERVTFSGTSISLVSNWFTVALIFFLFAEVLREGIRLRASEQQLRREQELTI